MKNIAQLPIFGTVNQPPGISRYGDFDPGINNFLNNIIKTLIVFAGLYALFNLLFAGYMFLGAGGDPKKVADAWAKIWQTVLGVTIAAGAFVLAALIGQVVFDDPNALLQLRIFGPN